MLMGRLTFLIHCTNVFNCFVPDNRSDDCVNQQCSPWCTVGAELGGSRLFQTPQSLHAAAVTRGMGHVSPPDPLPCISSPLSCSASLVGHTEAISVPTHKPDGDLSFGLQFEGAMKCSFIELSSSFPHSLPFPRSETPTLHKTKGDLIPSTNGSTMLCATIQIMEDNSPEEWQLEWARVVVCLDQSIQVSVLTGP